ncbi:unnamed protein product [Adineta ricciae]|uniref:Uncharacterized protein n=1 Tax=Adineta ricciae TaxID=249248 RepID=A0A815FJR7_ADIRI|nr:unnamed protein product [Adineta ricciae]CAF1319862.1 unnamed protein product [Adineta ricciae]
MFNINSVHFTIEWCSRLINLCEHESSKSSLITIQEYLRKVEDVPIFDETRTKLITGVHEKLCDVHESPLITDQIIKNTLTSVSHRLQATAEATKQSLEPKLLFLTVLSKFYSCFNSLFLIISCPITYSKMIEKIPKEKGALLQELLTTARDDIITKLMKANKSYNNYFSEDVLAYLRAEKYNENEYVQETFTIIQEIEKDLKLPRSWLLEFITDNVKIDIYYNFTLANSLQEYIQMCDKEQRDISIDDFVKSNKFTFKVEEYYTTLFKSYAQKLRQGTIGYAKTKTEDEESRILETKVCEAGDGLSTPIRHLRELHSVLRTVDLIKPCMESLFEPIVDAFRVFHNGNKIMPITWSETITATGVSTVKLSTEEPTFEQAVSKPVDSPSSGNVYIIIDLDSLERKGTLREAAVLYYYMTKDKLDKKLFAEESMFDSQEEIHRRFNKKSEKFDELKNGRPIPYHINNPSMLLRICAHVESTESYLPPKDQCFVVSSDARTLNTSLTEVSTLSYPNKRDPRDKSKSGSFFASRNVSDPYLLSTLPCNDDSQTLCILATQITRVVCQKNTKRARLCIISDRVTALRPAIDLAIENNISVDVWTWKSTIENEEQYERLLKFYDLKKCWDQFGEHQPIAEPYWCILFKKSKSNSTGSIYRALLQLESSHVSPKLGSSGLYSSGLQSDFETELFMMSASTWFPSSLAVLMHQIPLTPAPTLVSNTNAYRHKVPKVENNFSHVLVHGTDDEYFLAFRNENYRKCFQIQLKQKRETWANILDIDSAKLYDYKPACSI